MKSFPDNVDSSMQKLRTILASGLKQFKSSLSKSENAKLSEEIINTITSDIKEYLVNIHNVTIDQISGRFESKFQNAKFAISDDSLAQIKEILQQINSPVQETKTTEKTTVVETTTVAEKESKENGETSKENTKTNDIMNWLSSLGLLEKLDELKTFFQENIVQEEQEQEETTEDEDKSKEEKEQESFLSKLFGLKKVPKWFNKKFLEKLLFDVKYVNKFLNRINKRFRRVIRPILSLDRQLLALNKALLISAKLLYVSKKTLALSNITLAISNILLASANVIYATALILLAVSNIILAASNIVLAIAKFILSVVKLSFALLVLTVLTTFLLFVISITITLIITILSFVMLIVTTLLSLTVSLILSLSMFILTTLITAISISTTLLTVATIFIVAILGMMLAIVAISLAIFLAIAVVTIVAAGLLAVVLITAALVASLVIIVATVMLLSATAILAIAMVAAGSILLIASTIFVLAVAALSIAILVASAILTFGLAATFIAITAIAGIVAGVFILTNISLFALGFSIILEGVWLLISVVLIAVAAGIAAIAAAILAASLLIAAIVIYVILGILLLFFAIYAGFNGIWDSVKGIIKEFYDAYLKPIFDKIKLIYDKYFTQLFSIFSPQEPNFKGIMNYFSKFGDLFRNLMEAFDLDISNFTFAGMFKNIWETIKPGITGAFVRSELFKQLVGKFAMGLLNTISMILGIIKTLTDELGISTLFPVVGEKITGTIDKINSTRSTIVTFTKEAEAENKNLDKKLNKQPQVIQIPAGESVENINEAVSVDGTDQLKESTEKTMEDSQKTQQEIKIEEAKKDLDDGVLETLQGLEKQIDETPTAVIPIPSYSNENIAANG